MVLGTRNMPLPITVPTTMDAAAQAPKSRFNSVTVDGLVILVYSFGGAGGTARPPTPLEYSASPSNHDAISAAQNVTVVPMSTYQVKAIGVAKRT